MGTSQEALVEWMHTARLRQEGSVRFFFSFFCAELAPAGIECRAPVSDPPRDPLVYLRPCMSRRSLVVLLLFFSSLDTTNSCFLSVIMSCHVMHQCPPCRGFTPQMANWCTSNLKAKGLEIVFVSQTGVWLPASMYSQTSLVRMRGGARFPWHTDITRC